MQEHTKKEQDSAKPQRPNGVQVVDASRLAPRANVLREAQMNLVRAEQNLVSLVQAGHIAGPPFGSGASYPGPQAFPAGYPASAYASGFASSSAFPTPVGPAFGTVPSINPWVQATQPALAAWSPWTAGIQALPGTLHPSAAFGQAFAAGSGAFVGNTAIRTPVCDIVDEGKQFVCQLELPGIAAGQVELLCFERAVAVNAFREAEGDIANLVQSERGNAIQQRIIALPDVIQPGLAKATLRNGILTIALPKAHPTEGPCRIAVQGEADT